MLAAIGGNSNTPTTCCRLLCIYLHDFHRFSRFFKAGAGASFSGLAGESLVPVGVWSEEGLVKSRINSTGQIVNAG